VLRTSYRRAAFQLSSSNAVRVSLDTQAWVRASGVCCASERHPLCVQAGQGMRRGSPICLSTLLHPPEMCLTSDYWAVTHSLLG
jgi:hypothetical protein